MRSLPVLVLATIFVWGLACLPTAPVRAADDPTATLGAITGIAPADREALADRFRREIWPLLTNEPGAEELRRVP